MTDEPPNERSPWWDVLLFFLILIGMLIGKRLHEARKDEDD